MAIKLTTESIVKMVHPSELQFTLDELNEHVSGWIEPFKVGPIWIMYKENSKETGEPLNKVASLFFNIAMYGTVLIVPPQQMPPSWDLTDESDRKYTAEQVDTGFLSALQTALVHNRVIGQNKEAYVPTKEDWTYVPPNEVDDETISFFNQSYWFIVQTKRSVDDNILYEDERLIVRALPADRLKTLHQMMDYYISLEEYEKCSELKKIIDFYK